MNKRKKAVIHYSRELDELRLRALIGRTGTIVQHCKTKEGVNRGAYVKLDKPYRDELEWFIPASALTYYYQNICEE